MRIDLVLVTLDGLIDIAPGMVEVLISVRLSRLLKFLDIGNVVLVAIGGLTSHVL